MTLPEEPNRDDRADGDDRDYDALSRSIVESYGERPVLDPVESGEEELPGGRSGRLPGPALFDTSHLEPEPPPVEPSWHRRDPSPDGDPGSDRERDRAREEHFVPPEPPPVPRGTPARRMAWLGLFLAPLVMLTAVAFGWVLADWVSMLLVAAFVGGFVFLVATMPRGPRDDGDDGAVV
jgi:hypothetical protein